MKYLFYIKEWLCYWRYLYRSRKAGKLADYAIPRLRILSGRVDVRVMLIQPCEKISFDFIVDAKEGIKVL